MIIFFILWKVSHNPLERIRVTGTTKWVHLLGYRHWKWSHCQACFLFLHVRLLATHEPKDMIRLLMCCYRSRMLCWSLVLNRILVNRFNRHRTPMEPRPMVFLTLSIILKSCCHLHLIIITINVIKIRHRTATRQMVITTQVHRVPDIILAWVSMFQWTWPCMDTAKVHVHRFNGTLHQLHRQFFAHHLSALHHHIQVQPTPSQLISDRHPIMRMEVQQPTQTQHKRPSKKRCWKRWRIRRHHFRWLNRNRFFNRAHVTQHLKDRQHNMRWDAFPIKYFGLSS